MDLTSVYLVRSARYQFFDCGVLLSVHVEIDLHSTNFGIAEGNMAKKAKKAKKAAKKKTAKKK